MFRKALYILIQCTWGLPQTLVGFVLFLINIRKRHYFYHGCIATEWKSLSSISLGLFIFVSVAKSPAKRKGKHISSEEAEKSLVVHEYGHTIQSLFLGPLYLPVIGLPSLIWATVPKYVQKRKNGTSYSSFWTEKGANRLGEKVTGEPSLRDIEF